MSAIQKKYQGLSSLVRSARQVTRPVLGARGFSNTDIIENWSDILGTDLSMGIAPIKLVFPAGGHTHGILHVKSAGGAFAMMCEHQKNRILNRLNTYFGYPAVRDLKIIQGSLRFKQPLMPVAAQPVSVRQKADLKKRVDMIENPELRQQVYDIGLSLLSKKTD